MAKIVIIAPAEADADVKDAVKLLKAAGYDVDTEEPTPKSLLHIVLGLMGPNAYGFGPGYAYGPGGGGDAGGTKDDPGSKDDPADKPEDDKSDDTDTTDDAAAAGFDDESGDLGGDDFNFESLGKVTVDGQLIEAITHDSDTSVLCVQGLTKGAKTTYTLNESSFSFWPASITDPVQRVEVIVENKLTSIEIPIKETHEDKSILRVGKDLLPMFKK